MRKSAKGTLFAAAAALVFPGTASAHGIGGVRDLPVPLWLFYYGAAIVLVVSFVALGVLWRRAWLESRAEGRPAPEPLQRIILSPVLRFVLGVLSFALLGVVTAAALVGDLSVDRNLAPIFVYVIFWLGLVPVVVLFGNVWSALNPWRAAADAYVWVANRLGLRPAPVVEYPVHWGRWPAALFLFLWAVLELAYFEPGNPRAVGIAILFYSALTWYGMAVFGRRAWLERGEAFNVYFGLLGRLSPLAVRDDGRREIVLRPPLAGLSIRDPVPGTLAFVAVMLGSVTFDGFSRTSFWQNRRFDLTSSYVETSPTLAKVVWTLFNAAGLILVIGFVALAFVAAIGAARHLAGEQLPRSDFVLSLVPIALAYAVAHYFSLLVQRGQYIVPLASDPFGFGWDLFGTADYRPRLQVLSSNVTAYVQVTALVVGHVLGLVLAHDRAVALFRSARTALNAQYALLALMVLYTVTGLWLLWQG
jgi:hypothetical protein